MGVGHGEIERRYDLVTKLLKRNVEKYRALQMRTPGAWGPLSAMSERDQRLIRDWFEDWHTMLRRELAAALNEHDGVIGKQWHYDYIVDKSTLPPR